jgi:hypothetical protein
MTASTALPMTASTALALSRSSEMSRGWRELMRKNIFAELS